MNSPLTEAIARRFPDIVQADGLDLVDLENDAVYRPSSARDAIGWVAAGSDVGDGQNPRVTRLANHWRARAISEIK